MLDNLPILVVILPLLAAPVCILLRNHRVVWAWSVIVAWSVFIISIRLAIVVLLYGDVSYALGGWAAPWGIEYHVDAFNAFVLLIVSANASIVLLYAPHSVVNEIHPDKRYLMYALFLLCMAGLLGITITGDLFNVFVFLEISALSTYALISMGHTRRALTSAYRYLIMGTIGSTFILLGIGLVYMMTGTLNMADLQVRLDEVEGTRTILAAFGFITVGVSLKMALFPLHSWLPNAYTYAPSIVSAFIASTATKVSFYLFARIIFSVFGADFVFFGPLDLQYILLPLGLAGALIGTVIAIFQTNVKRLLAYSSVAQIGYMTVGLSLATVTGLTGSIVHMFNHALMKGGLFLVMGCIFYRLGSVELKDLRGVGRTMPLTTAAFVLGGLNLIGVPLTAGFVSKWYLVLAAIQEQLWVVVVLILVGSLLSVVYVWRVVEVAYFCDPPEDSPKKEAPAWLLVPTWMMLGATVYFGIFDKIPVMFARRAAETLLGVSP
jgi:multicomponent Na+:H+ antiporter subunit D